MARKDDLDEEGFDSEPSEARALLFPLGVFIVVVAVICALVLSGVVQGDPHKRPVVGPATTTATIEIAP